MALWVDTDRSKRPGERNRKGYEGVDFFLELSSRLFFYFLPCSPFTIALTLGCPMCIVDKLRKKESITFGK